jgi:glycosyltransferase involved in cell wall biosynthesis
MTARVLFLDQSGNLGGAELCLLDIAKPYRDRSLVALLADGPFRHRLEQEHIPVQVLTDRNIKVRKGSSLLQGLASLGQLLPLILQVAHLSHNYDAIYANTQKALVIGAIASFLSRRPLVYHLHDILSLDHFSPTNRRLIITLVNRFATAVIANSQASQTAFVEAGGRPDLTTVIYNGFDPAIYLHHDLERSQLRHQLQADDKFVVGHFSRLSPWKGQHILIEALLHCSDDVVAVFVGDALFGEDDYKTQLQQQIATHNLCDRVHFLGFRSDIPQLMTACDLVAHTSTAPEPFGRVIVEAMLCGRPVAAAAAGGAIELIEHGKTGWLCPPGDPHKLAEIIMASRHSDKAMEMAHTAQSQASERYSLATIDQQIAQLLRQVVKA